jgi:hypothetical protein
MPERSKQMDLRALTYGVELECTGRTREQVACAVQSVVGGAVRHVGIPAALDPWEIEDPRGRVWKVVADASLTSAPSGLRAEVVSPVLRYEDLAQYQEVIRAVRRCGVRAPAGAGLHIHIGAEPFDGRTLANLAKIIYKQEEIILYALGVTPERLARYTRPISEEFIRRIERAKPRTKEDLNPLWYGYRNANPTRYDQSRYCMVNINSAFFRNTIEFRFYNSTLHAGKIKMIAQFSLALAAKALNARSACSRKRTFDPQSAKYDMRVFLISGLKMIGDEFKTARKHLLALMPGDAAFKRGRPQRQAAQDTTEETTLNPSANTETGAGDAAQPEHFEEALA